ncbi:hypothetical protein ACG98G_00135 [Megasphaera hexanoica]|uniref:Ribbon-helix-helix protein CopG domain-containing protein n=1 Tax=Megasphaera hexanoica TaxID=1675036 RepID=A0ABW7DRP3_9FIRM|nr:hypothetical protein [Megasphaera hexanoica]AXB81768.1 hypothetical protein ACT01_05725 [Megasphaera hexanoica]
MGYAARMKKANKFKAQKFPHLSGGMEPQIYQELHGNVSPRYELEQALLNKYLTEMKDQITTQALDYMIVIVMNALHDEFGFGVKRCQAAFERIERITSCVNVTVSWDELTRFMACDFNEKEYAKRYGPRSKYDAKDMDRKMSRIIRIMTTDDLYEKLEKMAEKRHLSVNQMAIKILAKAVELEASQGESGGKNENMRHLQEAGQ